MTGVREIPVHDPIRVRDVRVAAGAAGLLACLDPHRTAVAALVSTEPATHLLKHAGGGRMVIERVDRLRAGTRTRAVQLTALDHGPGMHDPNAATLDGCTASEASLGAGLGTCLRVSSVLDLYSTRRGTVAVARIDQDTGQQKIRSVFRAGGTDVPLGQAEHAGDAWSWAHSGARPTLLLADGLGHGAEATDTSGAAVEELQRSAHLPPAEIPRRMHTALRPTRGAAVAVAQLNTDGADLTFAGLGNVGARLHTTGSWEHLASHPGIVGARFPAPYPYGVSPGGRAVCSSCAATGCPAVGFRPTIPTSSPTTPRWSQRPSCGTPAAPPARCATPVRPSSPTTPRSSARDPV